VWRRARQYDPGKAGVLNWMAVIARNRSIARLRGRRVTAPIDEAGEIADDAPSAFEMVEAADDRTRLAGCLEELEEKPRRVIRTAFFEGLSYAELASREAVPLGTMKSWIRRGLLRLRGCLDR
jgi:RNA polymerase sigma-70 factor (ECF subfamily)